MIRICFVATLFIASISAFADPLDDLFAAIESGDEHAFTRALEAGAAINDRRVNGTTPLHAAVARGRLQMAVVLLNRGARVDIRDAQERTPLHLAAAMHDNLLVVNVLLARGANRHATTTDGSTPAHLAARANNLLTFCRLLMAGADPFARDRRRRAALDLLETRATPLHLPNNLRASQAIPRNLFEASLSTSNSLEPSRTLHMAAAAGDFDLVFVLLQRGALLESIERLRNTPLLEAATAGHLMMCLFLIANGANMNARNANGHNFIDLLMARGDARTRELLQHLIPQRDQFGMTLVHHAVVLNRPDLIDDLADQGADLEFPDDAGMTPLHLAANEGHEAALGALLRHHVRVNLRDNAGMTALHLAARWGYADAMLALIAHGADLYAEDQMRRTPWLFLGHHAHLRNEVLAGLARLNENYNPANTGVDAARLLIERLTAPQPAQETPLRWALGLLHPHAQTLLGAFLIFVVDQLHTPYSKL